MFRRFHQLSYGSSAQINSLSQAMRTGSQNTFVPYVYSFITVFLFSSLDILVVERRQARFFSSPEQQILVGDVVNSLSFGSNLDAAFRSMKA